MPTHASITYQDPDTKYFHSIYCHFDGYREEVGKILKEHYQGLEKIKKLVALGDISSLGKYVSPEDVPELIPKCKDYKEDWKHSFETPAQDVTVAYARDRGELKRTSVSFTYFNVYRYEYNYLWKDGSWGYYFAGTNRNSPPFTL